MNVRRACCCSLNPCGTASAAACREGGNNEYKLNLMALHSTTASIAHPTLAYTPTSIQGISCSHPTRRFLLNGRFRPCLAQVSRQSTGSAGCYPQAVSYVAVCKCTLCNRTVLTAFIPPSLSVHIHSSGSSNVVGVHYRVGKKIGEGSVSCCVLACAFQCI